MRIRHERPDADLAFNVSAPLKLTLQDGQELHVCHWSLSGFDLSPLPDIAPTRGTLSIPFQGVDIAFPVTFAQAAEGSRFVWTNLTVRQRETLQVFYNSLLSGRMASTDDMITSLDTPVDLVPMGETEAEVAADPKSGRSRSLRALWNILAYALTASVIVGVLGSNIVSRVSQVPIQHGRVVAEFQSHIAPDAGYVDAIHIAPGDAVFQGAPLVSLSHPDDAATLDALRRDLRRVEARLEAAQADVARHAQARAEAEAPLIAAVAAVMPHWQDFLSGRDLHAFSAASDALAAFRAGHSATPGDYNDIARVLATRLTEVEAEHGQLKRDLASVKSHAAARDIRAMSDGWVTEVTVYEDQFIARGTRAIEIEVVTARFLRGWVSEARAQALVPGQSVRVDLVIAGERRVLDGVVDSVTAGLDETVGAEFGTLVDVSLPGLDAAAMREALVAGTPARMTARRTMPWDLRWP